MKTIFYRQIIWIGVLLCSLCSCYEDQSTYDVHTIGDVVIDTTTIPDRIFAKFGQELALNVSVTKINEPNAELDYLWRISAGRYDTARIVIGREKDLKTKIMITPSDFDYTLSFTVTDKSNGLQYSIQRPINVSSTLGNGLLVMDSQDDQSDIHFIMSSEFSANSANEVTMQPMVYRNLFSEKHGKRMEGIAQGLHYNKGPRTFLAITCITDKSLIRLNPLDYSIIDQDGGAFFVAPATIAPSGIVGGPDKAVVVNDGKIYMHNGQNDTRYMTAFSGDYRIKRHVALHSDFSWVSCGASGVAYDEINDRFLLLPMITGMGTPMMVFKEFTSGAFDPNNPGNLTCLYAGLSMDRHWGFVMKEESNNKIFVYEINGKVKDSGASGKRKIDISTAPGISDASQFTFSPIEDVLYYTANKKLYAIVLSKNADNVIECCDISTLGATSNEVLTSLSLYGGKGFILNNGNTTPSANRVLVLGSYDELTKQGAVYSVPISNLNTGIVNKEQIKRFDGFKKVLITNVQGM